ncbi:Cytochrome P450 monooxygenase andK [Paramyrothecium foliicola]|nr:Cytochrome P450 monooxygenase andK [Paramyrothecium foliicola]
MKDRRLPGPLLHKFTTLPFLFYTLRGSADVYAKKLHKKYGPIVQIGPKQVSVNDVAGMRDVFLGARRLDRPEPLPVFHNYGAENLVSTVDGALHQEPMSPTGAADIRALLRFALCDIMSHVAYGAKHKLNLVGNEEQRTAMQEDINFQEQRQMSIAAGIMFFSPNLTLWMRRTGIAPIWLDGQIHGDLYTDRLGREALRDLQASYSDQTEGHESLIRRLYNHFRNNGPSVAVPSLDNSQRQVRLWEEIRQAAIEAGIAPCGLSAERLKQLPYLNAVIKETLRLHPPIPFSMERKNMNRNESLSIHGYNIPAGWRIASQAMSMQRKEEVYDDAASWHPERWLESDDKQGSRQGLKEMKANFYAFGSGPRMCLGINVAWSAMRGIVAGVYGTVGTEVAKSPQESAGPSKLHLGQASKDTGVVKQWLQEKKKQVWLRFVDLAYRANTLVQCPFLSHADPAMAFEGMDPPTVRAILLVQLADLNAIAASQRQRTPAGAMTDLTLAVNSYKADLRALAQDSGHIDSINQALERADAALAGATSTTPPATSTTNAVPAFLARNFQQPQPTAPSSAFAASGTAKRKANDDPVGQPHPSQRSQGATIAVDTSVVPGSRERDRPTLHTRRADHENERKRKARESAPSPPPYARPRLSLSGSTLVRPDGNPKQQQRAPQIPETHSTDTSRQHSPAPSSALRNQSLNNISNLPSSRPEQLLPSPVDPSPAADVQASQTPASFTSPPVFATQESSKPPQKSCLICTDSYDEADVSKLQCGHEYCRHCLQTLFNTAINDESLFPPRCCRKPILVDRVRHYLPRELTDKFEWKKIEYSTPNRVYCHVQTCSTFIPPNCNGKCPACGEITCVDCKRAMHIGRPCAEDEATEQLFKLAVENGMEPPSGDGFEDPFQDMDEATRRLVLQLRDQDRREVQPEEQTVPGHPLGLRSIRELASVSMRDRRSASPRRDDRTPGLGRLISNREAQHANAVSNRRHYRQRPDEASAAVPSRYQHDRADLGHGPSRDAESALQTSAEEPAQDAEAIHTAVRSNIGLAQPRPLQRRGAMQGLSEQYWKQESLSCCVCFENVSLDAVISLPCHNWCADCLRRRCLMAMEFQSKFPPRCCFQGEPIPTYLARKVLNPEQLQKFERMDLEYRTENRIYCHAPTCSTFIPPHSIESHGNLARCPQCSLKTCTLCKGPAHGATECKVDHGIEQTLRLAEANEWRQCYFCGHMVERQYGCRRIRCICGAIFCYHCGLQWKSCDCGYFDSPTGSVPLEEDEYRAMIAEAEAMFAGQAHDPPFPGTGPFHPLVGVGFGAEGQREGQATFDPAEAETGDAPVHGISNATAGNTQIGSPRCSDHHSSKRNPERLEELRRLVIARQEDNVVRNPYLDIAAVPQRERHQYANVVRNPYLDVATVPQRERHQDGNFVRNPYLDVTAVPERERRQESDAGRPRVERGRTMYRPERLGPSTANTAAEGGLAQAEALTAIGLGLEEEDEDLYGSPTDEPGPD